MKPSLGRHVIYFLTLVGVRIFWLNLLVHAIFLGFWIVVASSKHGFLEKVELEVQVFGEVQVSTLV